MHVMHVLFSPTVVNISWVISHPIDVIEGEVDPSELVAQAFGVYATPIEIGVACSPVITTGIPPGANAISSTNTLERANIYHTSPICL